MNPFPAKMLKRFLPLFLFAFCLSSAQATLLIADFNDIATGQLSGKAGGTGWTGNWTGSVNISVVTNNLSSSLYNVTQSGTAQHIQSAGTAIRQTFRTPTLSLGGEIWFSYLASNSIAANTAGISFNPSTTTPFDNPGSAFLQFTGTSLVYRFGQGSDQTILNQSTLGATSLVVGRFVINGSGAADTVQIWVNPDLIATPNITLLTPVISDSSLNFADSLGTIGTILYGGSSSVTRANLDALRISDGGGNATTAYQDVTAVPEPSTYALLAVALVVMLVTRRKLTQRQAAPVRAS